MMMIALVVGLIVSFAVMFAIYRFVPGGLYINGILVVVGGAVGMWVTKTLTVGNIFYLVLFAAGICFVGYLKSSSSR